MALEDIIRKILSDAQQQADKIKQEASKEAEDIRREAQQKAEKIKQDLIAKAEQRARQEKERIVTLAKLEFRKELLKEKQTGIEEAFQKAQKHLMKLCEKDYKTLIKRLLLRAVETGNEEVIVSPKDRKILTDAFLKEVNASLGKGGGTLKLCPETRNIRGGFILRQGRMEINCSLEAIFRIVREDLEPEVATILFRE